MISVSEIFSEAELDTALQAGFVEAFRHPTAPLTIYNYTEQVQFDNAWNAATLACRERDAPGAEYSAPDLFAVRACARFSTIDELVQRALDPAVLTTGEKVQPSGPGLIGLADTLSNADRQGLSRSLDRALTAYANSLTSLAAHPIHQEPNDEVEEMTQVVSNNGAVIKALCREPGTRGGSTSGTTSVPDPDMDQSPGLAGTMVAPRHDAES